MKNRHFIFNFHIYAYFFIFISVFMPIFSGQALGLDEIEERELQAEKLSEVVVQVEEPEDAHEVVDHNARLPFVVKTKPLDAETDVSLNTQIRIIFNKPMDYLSINSSSIMVMDEVGSVVEGTISYDSSSYTATFTPRTIMSKNTLYSLFIPSYLIRDTEGNPLDRNLTISFRTESKSEVTKIYENRKSPKVIKNYPDTNATDVALDTYVIVDFNLALLGSRITDTTLKLNDGARDIDGKTVYSDKERQLIFVPGRNLEYGKVYRVTLSSMQVESVHGFKMTENYSWTFSTKKPRDEAPPEVIATSPIDGSYDVSEQARISATFSEEMDPVSLNKYTIILSDGNQDISGKITYDKRTSKAAFFPLEKLKTGQKYTVLISNGAKDTAGNAMQSPREWTFTTRKPVVVEKPRIDKTYPADKEKDIKPDSKIFVYFNKVMNESTCNVFNIKLTGNSKTMAVSASFVKNGNFVTIVPLENFDFSTEYKVSVSSRVTDIDGQKLDGDYSFSFTTMAKPDIVAPEIVRVTPDDGALNVALNTVISIRFSEPVMKNSISASAVSVKNEKGMLIKGYTQYEDDQNLLTFIPESRFDYLTKYVITVTDGIKDFAGNRLKSSKIWNFSTLQAPDTTPPRVISCLPMKGERDIDIKTAIQVIFTEKLAEGTVSGKTFQLYDSNGAEVSAAVTYDQIMKRVTITPRRDLEYGMIFKIVVSKQVSDLAGNYMNATYISDFGTVAAPDRTRPELCSTVPESGAINVALNTPISAVFTKRLDPMSVTARNVFLRNENDRADVAAEIVYNDLKKQISIIPKDKLKFSTTYQVVISRGVTDSAGNLFNATVVFEFSTLDEPDLSAPEIKKSAPADTARGVAIDTSICLWLNEKIKDSTATEKNITLSRIDGAAFSDIFCKIAYNERDLKVIVTPISKLRYSSKYKLSARGLADSSGNCLKSAYNITFETESEPDNDPPEITECFPPNGSKNVSTATPIYVRFSEPVDTLTIGGDALRLSAGPKSVGCEIIYQPDSCSVVIKPERSLDFDKMHTIEVSPEVSDHSSNKMGARFVSQFKTMEKPDFEKPKVKSIIPANASVAVAKNIQIQAVLTKKIKAATMNRFTFFVNNETNGETVDGRISYLPAKNTAVFTPSEELREGSIYRATLTEGVTDAAGNPLEKGISWAFTVGKPRDNSKFELMTTYPRDNELNIDRDMEITAVFNKVVNENTANEYTILVSDGVKSVRGSISLDPAGRKVTFKPESPLRNNTLYSVTITNGLEDTDGRPLFKRVRFSFKTKSF